jgi:hypothetical protein
MLDQLDPDYQQMSKKLRKIIWLSNKKSFHTYSGPRLGVGNPLTKSGKPCVGRNCDPYCCTYVFGSALIIPKLRNSLTTRACVPSHWIIRFFWGAGGCTGAAFW